MSKKNPDKANKTNKNDHAADDVETPLSSDEQSQDENAAKNDAEIEADIPENVTLSREQIIELRTQIENLQKDRQEYLDTAQRVQADFDNYRKRNATLRLDSIDEGIRDTVSAMLPVLDNLDRAIDASLAGSDDSSLVDGVKLIAKQFNDVLEKLNVSPIDSLGQDFDPEKHHAVAQGSCDKDQKAGVVQEVFMKGYIHKERVIRPSMVKVSCENA